MDQMDIINNIYKTFNSLNDRIYIFIKYTQNILKEQKENKKTVEKK